MRGVGHLVDPHPQPRVAHKDVETEPVGQVHRGEPLGQLGEHRQLRLHDARKVEAGEWSRACARKRGDVEVASRVFWSSPRAQRGGEDVRAVLGTPRLCDGAVALGAIDDAGVAHGGIERR